MTETVAAPRNLLEIYTRRRDELLSLARRQAAVVADLGADQVQSNGDNAAETMAGLIERIESERLRVLVIGRFSAGKSTLLNALLFGTVVLPSSPEPTTGVLCEIRFAEREEKKAILYPKADINDDQDRQPRTIRTEDLHKELDKVVRIDHSDAGTNTSRYQKLELFWPIELCRHNVDFIDSVGLDDPEARDEITLQHAKSADAILYCLKSMDCYSARDKQVLSMLQGLGYNTIFFVITYYDHIRNSAMIGETTEEAWRRLQEKNLSPLTELGRDGIKYVDSQSALLGKMKNNSALLAESGILDVQRSLEQFLALEKGRAKLLTSLRSLRSVNRAVGKVLPTHIELLQMSAADLEQRYRNAEVPLRTVEITRRLILSKVDADLKDVAREASDLIKAYFLELPDRVKAWAADYEFETKVGLPPSRSNIEAAVQELSVDLKTRITADLGAWCKQSLAPMMDRRVDEMRDTLEESARDFVRQVEQVRADIALGVDANELTSESDVPLWKRLVGGGLGALTNPIGIGMGIAFGPLALAKTVVVQLAAAAIFALLGITNPLVAIPLVLIAGGLGGGAWTLLSLQKKIRSLVGEKFADELGSRRDELTRELNKKVNASLALLRSSIDMGLGGEIGTLRAQVESALEQHKSGQVHVTREIKRLREIDQGNQEIDKEVDEVLLSEGLGL